MKTTVELPDTLYRQTKAEAALRGRKLKDLVEKGLRLVLEAPADTARHPDLRGGRLRLNSVSVPIDGFPAGGLHGLPLRGIA